MLGGRTFNRYHYAPAGRRGDRFAARGCRAQGLRIILIDVQTMRSPRKEASGSEETLKAQLWQALVSDARFDASGVTLAVEAGVAILIGEVESAAAKRAVGELAWDAAGVLDVSNQIVVRPLGGVWMVREQSVHDEHLDLISTLYYLTQGDRTYSQYALDAKHADDEELARFFHEVQEQYQQLAARAKALLLARLSDAQHEQGKGEQHVST